MAMSSTISEGEKNKQKVNDSANCNVCYACMQR